MKLRIPTLADIDPLRVPLPHGTEVTTRVDRRVEGRVIKQGALGRVRAIEADVISVHIVGVGTVPFAREEIIPRKSGQLEYAVRRQASWMALKKHMILETVVGSRAWGLADEHSDTDRRGVFVLPFPWTTGLVEAPSDLISVDGSENYWEVGKAVRQGIRADPNTLETLFLPGATATDTMGEWLLAEVDAFASIEIYGSFGRYALSQLKRMKHNLRLAEHRKLLLEWLVEDASMTLDQAASKLVARAEVQGNSVSDRTHRAKEYIKQLYSSMFDQGLLNDRNYAALQEYARDAESHEFSAPRDLRPKNAYNLLRLLSTATDWLTNGTPNFEVSGTLRDELLAIKRQEVDMPMVMARAEVLAEGLEEARKRSTLPEHPDVERIDAVLRRIREEAARRWFDREPSVFGTEMPELGLAEWT